MNYNYINRLGLLKTKVFFSVHIPTGLAILITLLNLQTIFTLVQNFWARVNLGLDLTDESFNLMNLTHREDNSVWPYSRVLGPIFNLLEENIANYRLFGLVFLFLICIIGITVTLLNARYKNHSNFMSLPALISLQIVITLFVPSVFRYLLVTPGYQWILIVGSILLAIILIGVIPRFDKLGTFLKLTLIGVSLILLAMSLARLSGGVIALLSVSLGLAWKRSASSYKKLIVFLYLSMFLTSGVFLILNFELVKNYASTMLNFSNVLPQAFSIKSELTDVFLPIICLSLLIALNKFVLQFASNRFSYERVYVAKNIYILGALPILTIILSRSDVILNFQLPHNSLAIFCLIALVLTLNLEKTDILIFPVILLPFLTLFGSSTPAFGNWQTMLFCIYSLIIFYACLRDSSGTQIQFGKEHVFVILLIVSVSCSILANRITSDTYEKVLLPRHSPVDLVTGLNYSSGKLNSINSFRSSSLENGFNPDKSILDLSYFHPGLALMLGSSTEPNTIYDRFFQSSLNLQVDNLAPTLKRFVTEKGFILLPVERDRLFSKFGCRSIASYLAIDPLAQLFSERGFNPKVRFISVYRSDSIDLTLPNNDVVLVKVC